MSVSGITGPGFTSNPYATTQKNASTGLAAASGGSANDAISEFMDWANKTPAQKMRDQVLTSMGIKESDLASMDPKQRQAIEKKIADEIKQMVQQSTEKKTGVAVDIKA